MDYRKVFLALCVATVFGVLDAAKFRKCDALSCEILEWKSRDSKLREFHSFESWLIKSFEIAFH